MGKAEKSLKQPKAAPYSIPQHRAVPTANQDQPNKTTVDLHKVFSLNESVSRIAISKFVTKFFQIYDNYDRGYLTEFFHHKASFGLFTDTKAAWIMNYQNVLCGQKKGLPIGPDNIVAYLNILPMTFHLNGDLLDNKISQTADGVNFAITGKFEMIRGTATFLLYYTHRFHLVPDMDGRPLIRHYRQHIKFELDTVSDMIIDPPITPVPPTPALPQNMSPKDARGPVTTSNSTTPASNVTQGATGGSTTSPNNKDEEHHRQNIEFISDAFSRLTIDSPATPVPPTPAQPQKTTPKKTKGAKTTSNSTTPASNDNQGAKGGSTKPSNKQVLKGLIKLSGMFEEHADKCLQMNNWNLEQAVNAFNTLKGNIPEGCFYRIHGKVTCPPNKNIHVFQFAAVTNLRVPWAEKCLEDHNWDWKKAKGAFDYLKAQDKIPSEAFYTTESSSKKVSKKESLVALFSKGSGLKEDWSRQFIKDANGNYSQAIREFLFQKQFQQIPAEAFIP